MLGRALKPTGLACEEHAEMTKLGQYCPPIMSSYQLILSLAITPSLDFLTIVEVCIGRIRSIAVILFRYVLLSDQAISLSIHASLVRTRA